MLFGGSFALCRPRFNALAFGLSDSLCERGHFVGARLARASVVETSTLSTLMST
jgi:hypothetical protein